MLCGDFLMKVIMETYNPTWLVKLAKQQRPELTWLHEALAKCTTSVKKETDYLYFVSADRPNLPESEWQHERSIELNCPENGYLVVDILKGERVGGVEFVNKI